MGWLKKLIPTHTLFGRVFLWFWLVSILLTSGGSFVARAIINTNELKPIDSETMTRFGAIAEMVQLQLQDVEFVPAALHAISRAKAMPMLLIPEDGRRPVYAMPRPMRPQAELVEAIKNESEPRLIQTVRADFIGPYTLELDNKQYAFFVGEPKPFSFLFAVNQRYPWQLPLMIFLLSGACCFLLVWNLLRPIKQLQAATQKMAAGDLHARVGEKVLGEDEIGQLGRDYNRMADKVSQQVDAQKRLLADISHELRSPLARQQVAMSLVRKTLRHNDNAGMLKAIDRIELENERLNDMIGQLLMLSRLEASQVFEFARVDLNMLLQRLCVDATFEAEAKQKRIEFFEHDTAIIEGNHELLLRAIENVVRNAIHYANRHIQVSLTNRDGVITLCVVDDGPGVAEEELAQLFNPFYRLSEARDRHTGGVGLGLAIARQAAQAHGGKIMAKNTETGGLSVCIQLPQQYVKTSVEQD